MIDTHAHIYLPAFKKDLDHVLDKASSAGVTDICMPAIDAQSLNQMKSVSHPAIRFHKMAGLHPCEVNHRLPDLRSMLEPLLNEEEFIAVGETGLDYYWSKDHIKEQKESFEVQLEMAKAFQKPIVIHNRNSTEDMLALVEKHQDGRLSGVWHCFNGTL
ncbi:TatD family hydrolase, partial [Balneolaceae bacterium ANBcel3]|nr:TatD family hydrolase [Balneolaceae bacterium ANBcel3]